MGNHAYVMSSGPISKSLQIIDISSPVTPTLRGTYPLTYSAGMQVTGTLAYVTRGSSGLDIIDVSNPMTPVLHGRVDTPGNASDVAVVGNMAYVADGDNGLQVVDITDPISPTLRGHFSTPNRRAEGIQATGNLVYVAFWLPIAHEGQVWVFDVTDPDNPANIGTSGYVGGIHDMHLAGNILYIAAGDILLAMDVSDPTNPVQRGSFHTSSGFIKVYAAGNLVYVGDTMQGFRIVNASDPNNLTLLGALDPLMSIQDVVTAGQIAYLATGSKFQLVDVSVPNKPSLRGSLPEVTTGVYIVGNLAYIASSGGLEIIDVSNPDTPVKLGNLYLVT